MLHLIYILAFTVLALIAIVNLFRNLLTLNVAEARRSHSHLGYPLAGTGANQPTKPTPHPELLDESGRVVNEPLLVMRSLSVDDARERLDALYNRSPDIYNEAHEEGNG
ncbi:DUF2973 domain-containing protein [Trichothermofontia sp.]